MARAVDPKRTRKALKMLAALKDAASEGADAARFSEWEDAFITEVGERLETYGSAFADFSKGLPEDALSRLQQIKLQELRKKVRKAAKDAARPQATAENPEPRRSLKPMRKQKFKDKA
jgi:hypothetical protein